MKSKRYFIFSAIFTAIAGTLLHFLFDWSGEKIIIGVFSAVNESIFEHLKLLFWPFFATVLFGLFTSSENREELLFPSAAGVFIGLVFIVSSYYTYTAVIGKNIDWINILIFFLSVIVSYFSYYCLYKNRLFKGRIWASIGVAIHILIIFSLTYFTFNTPKTPLFKDPVDGFYGLPPKSAD